ncbi:MAG: hypothetical protein ACYCWW_13410 [Deltaproteobacteria bacterium]
MYHQALERVVAYATSDAHKDDVAAARKEFFLATGGEVFEDDKSVDSRLAAFVDWYVFDRTWPDRGLTPAQAFLADHGAEFHPTELPLYRGFTETVRGLFELRRAPKGERLRVRELCSDKELEVLERRQLAGLVKGDLFEARLVPWKGDLLFSQPFCYHPRPVKKLIVTELKRRKKAGTLVPAAFLDELLARALKYERYRNVAVEAIYRF